MSNSNNNANEDIVVADRLTFRNAMARVSASVNIITSSGSAGRGGFTATAMCSVTDDPPTLLVCMNRNSAQCAMFLENGQFCVNVLSLNHQELAGHFAGKTSDMDARYANGTWDRFLSGNLALSDAIVAFDCRLAESRAVGTHYVLFGEVVAIRQRQDGQGLIYSDREFVGIHRAPAVA